MREYRLIPTRYTSWVASTAIVSRFKGSDAGRVATQYGTFLKATDQIDHVELGISNKDVKAMSLSTRKLIELSFLALLDLGIDYRNKNIGCFA
jgi:acyl transferase domain-containing protein